MQKIIPHLWYDREAKVAAEFYVTLFEDSKIMNLNKIQDTPSGEVEIVDFVLSGMKFSSFSAGPYFAFNPSVSLMVSCKNILKKLTNYI
jgi:predicted 3-demethylubiquinone-9 3-methyltransferase (glyoxalase superfamily)